MKHKDNCEQLFEYLRSILYDDKVNALQIDDLEPAFEKLGKGMQYLEQAVREMKEYSAAISVGNLSVEAPPRENFLCKNLKNIHANLNHLSWQAKQVAKGDYSQSVSYLGEFSEAFNTMTKQLKEREQYLKQEAEREKTHANMVESYNQLLIQLIERSKEDILVLSKDRQEHCIAAGRVCQIQNTEKFTRSAGKDLQKNLQRLRRKRMPVSVNGSGKNRCPIIAIIMSLQDLWSGRVRKHTHILYVISRKKRNVRKNWKRRHIWMRLPGLVTVIFWLER